MHNVIDGKFWPPTKGYGLYDPEKKRILYSWDVKKKRKLKIALTKILMVAFRIELDFSDNTGESDEPQIETANKNRNGS